MKLSIIISTWNSIRYIKDCIDSIFSLDLDTEIIVVDSHSKDGTAEYLKSLGDKIRFLWSDKRLTWSEANQIGLDVSQGDWICLSNPDIIFNQSFKEMLEECQGNGVLVAAPQLVYPDGKIQPPAKTITPLLSLGAHTRTLRLFFDRAKTDYLFSYDPKGKKRVAVDSPQGSLFLFDRKVLDRFHGHLWNRGYLNGVSDFDAFLNIKRAGIPIWLFPQYRIVHYGSYITRRHPKWIERDQTRGLVLYFRYWVRVGSPQGFGWMSPRLYSVLFGLEGLAATGLEIAGKIIKHGNPFFTPRWGAWQAGQRILGLIDGWRYRI